MTVRRNEGRPAATGTAANQSKPRQQHNSTEAQRQRLLAALSRRPVDTILARRDLDILHPAGRVKELRDRGFVILTRMVERVTACGQKHRVALYALVKRPV